MDTTIRDHQSQQATAGDNSLEDDIDDAWDQYEEEQEAAATDIDRENRVASESVDDILQQLRQEFAMETGELDGPCQQKRSRKSRHLLLIT